MNQNAPSIRLKILRDSGFPLDENSLAYIEAIELLRDFNFLHTHSHNFTEHELAVLTKALFKKVNVLLMDLKEN